MAVVLYQTPHNFRGLMTIGKFVSLIDLIIFCAFCFMIILRFKSRPPAFIESLHHLTESFYFGTFWILVAMNSISSTEVNKVINTVSGIPCDAYHF